MEMDSTLKILEKYYGYKSFRKGQEEIINTIIEGKDILAIMPTGAGKSICYQVPALVFEGITIVISPLISLMKDQVDTLNSVGIKSAFINSTLDNMEIQEIIYGIRNKEYKIIYIAPERLDSREFLNIITEVKISQIAIDEAHCVSQWGHDFRISYRKIAYFIESLKNRPIITAFTATASDEVRLDIVRLLKLRNPKVFVSGFDRENLSISIIKEGRKDRFLQEYIKNNSDSSGIIYCATRKEVDSIYEVLRGAGYSVGKYHAGLKDVERKEFQELFVMDKINIMVATNAFGMGIDKPNIRYVIHNNMPQSIESYYQEIGRAGRDGEKSECILLFTPGDVHLQKYLIDAGLKNEERRNIAYKKLQDMVSLVYSADCYRKYILNYFGEHREEDCGNCSNCLAEGEKVDKTIDSQKVLSCIGRMKRSYGITLLVDVLRGSKNKKVLELGFDKLSTYGIMKDYKKDDLITFINTLISHGIIDQVEGTYPTLRLNHLSVKILKGEEKVILKEVKVKEKTFEVNELFDLLKALRFNIATEERIPPYLVFGDKSLKEMSNLYPENKEEFLKISGVGEVKFERYGEKFIEVIHSYVLENNIDKNNLNKEEKVNITKFYVETDNELYEKLRELRERFSKKEGKIAYSILAQDTLKEISGRYPLTIDELKDIGGIGNKKLDLYGKAIISLVNEYVTSKNISREWKEKGRLMLVIDGEERSHNEIAIAMLEEGYDIFEVSEKMDISTATILGYVTDYISENGKINFNINLEEFFNENEEEEILNICKTIGVEKIGDIKKKANSYITYQAIRAVILKNYYNVG